MGNHIGLFIKRVLGKKGLKVLSKVTGLILAAIAAQMILVGIRNAFSIPAP
jgi:multiple antibiotic resistance protein